MSMCESGPGPTPTDPDREDPAHRGQDSEYLALLEILAMGEREIEEGRVMPLADVIQRIREKTSTS